MLLQPGGGFCAPASIRQPTEHRTPGPEQDRPSATFRLCRHLDGSLDTPPGRIERHAAEPRDRCPPANEGRSGHETSRTGLATTLGCGSRKCDGAHLHATCSQSLTDPSLRRPSTGGHTAMHERRQNSWVRHVSLAVEANYDAESLRDALAKRRNMPVSRTDAIAAIPFPSLSGRHQAQSDRAHVLPARKGRVAWPPATSSLATTMLAHAPPLP